MSLYRDGQDFPGLGLEGINPENPVRPDIISFVCRGDEWFQLSLQGGFAGPTQTPPGNCIFRAFSNISGKARSNCCARSDSLYSIVSVTVSRERALKRFSIASYRSTRRS